VTDPQRTDAPPETQERVEGGAKNLAPRTRKKSVAGKLPVFRTALILIGIAFALVLAYVVMVNGVIAFWTGSAGDGPPKLDKEFIDSDDNYAISPPKGWTLKDRIPDTSIVIQGPRERAFSPIITVALDIAPGRLASFIDEYKGRMQHQQPGLRWLREEEAWVDGMRAVLLEFEFEFQDSDNAPKKELRSLQLVLEDGYRFYRVTGTATTETYSKYAAHFEACARSFRRLPLPKSVPRTFKD
jgi:hypothetical protein